MREVIAIRADANEHIGSGHIVRSLAVAEELRSLGEEAVFIVSDPSPVDMIRMAGFSHVLLETERPRTEEEAGAVIRAIERLGAGSLLVDAYFPTEAYFNRLRPAAGTAYMDDFGQRAYPVDILINCNVYADAAAYKNLYACSGTRLLLGPRYAPLRKEFRRRELPEIRRKLGRILITTGSSDPYGSSFALCRRILEDARFKDILAYAAAGRFYRNTHLLRELSGRYPHLTVCENKASLSRLMTECDAAVSACGTTLYELCACGTPAVIFSFADNQILMREAFGNKGAMLDCGDWRNGSERCLETIADAIGSLKSVKKRRKLRSAVTEITDGLGAGRLALELAACARERKRGIHC